MKSVTNFTLLFVVVLTLTLTGVSNQLFAQSNTSDKAKITVYYFHATHRCPTCEAVESVSKETVATYPENEVKFISLNREEKENSELVEKYKISGQTLLVVKGDKTEDLTTKAFMFARSKPEKLKKLLSETIDKMLK